VRESDYYRIICYNETHAEGMRTVRALLQEISNNIDNWYFRQKSMAVEVVF